MNRKHIILFCFLLLFSSGFLTLSYNVDVIETKQEINNATNILLNYSDDNTLVETDVPEVSDLRFYNYSNEHAFNLTAVVRDEEGNDDIQACRVKASNATQTRTFNMDIDRTYGDRDQLQCFYSNISENDFPVLGTLDIEVYALDTVGNEGNFTGVNTVPNSPPEIFGVRRHRQSRGGSARPLR